MLCIVPIVLYCTVLYCTVLYCTVLYCTVLYCTFISALDDVFVRKDLYEGRYAPDMEKQKLFELETNGNQAWYVGPRQEEFPNVKPSLENVKVEL